MPKRQYITLSQDCELQSHFPDAAGLKVSRIDGTLILHDAETQIIVQIMGMQDGSTSWVVIYSACDSPIRVERGRSLGKLFTTDELVLHGINSALDGMLAGWCPEFLPELIGGIETGRVTSLTPNTEEIEPAGAGKGSM